MLNQTYGCCTIAALGHAIQTWSLNSVGLELTPPDPVIFGAYRSGVGIIQRTHRQMLGAAEIDVLNAFRRDGLDGHSLLGYADPQVQNLTEIQQAINLFGGVYRHHLNQCATEFAGVGRDSQRPERGCWRPCCLGAAMIWH